MKKIILLTGANRGIGYGILKKLCKKNIIIGTSTNKNGIKKINKIIQNNGCGIKMNLNNIQSIKNIIKKIKYRYKKYPNILINNAGINNDKLSFNMSDKIWDKVIKINLSSTFKLTKRIIKCMIKDHRWGRIINICSSVSYIGNIGQCNYTTSKHAIIGMVKTISKEIAPYKITINNIAPGFIKTHMTDKISQKIKNKIIKKIPMKRFGTVQDIAHTINFLISKKTNYITGQTIHINGGLYML